MQNQSQQNQTREQKRAQFSEGTQTKSKTTPVLIVILLALVGAVAFVVLRSSGDKPAATAVTSSGETSSAKPATDIRIPLADLSSTAKFFNYTLSDSRPVRFFAVKSSDGVYRAALDACDMCYHAKKGYHQEGDDMVCNNCGLHFHSSQINEVHGGCNPVGLPRAIEGDQLVIKVSDLESRKQYF